MFARVAALVTLATATFVAATEPSCSTGPVQCCNSVQKASSPDAAKALGIVGAVVNADVPVGLTCTPVSVLAISGNSCNAQTVCCDGNNFSGAVVIGCTPVNINL